MGKQNKIQPTQNTQIILTVESQLDSLVKGQKSNSDELKIMGNDLQKGFNAITYQNGFLSLQNQELIELNRKQQKQLEEVLKELNQFKKEREDKKARKETWANRKRLPKRDPMTAEIYKELIKAAEGPSYINVRTRIALCLLAISGIRINELLSLKVEQLQTLVEESWIAIDRSKRGPSNHKAFLTKEGKKIIKDRQKDFQLIFLMKKPESFLFTSESHHFKPIRREVITKDVNKLMRQVSKQLNDKPNITSHSFRIGYITQLWKDTKDIEFVKQNIGHRKLDTTLSLIHI